ncbi:bifunctional metallophosphatase/5'-nucleotidase [Nonomuraea sp. MG754425]|uniref:bifunctional metallophosphatase/5'-nucleotidase n=1 Tax=Nonomuraea sp. MG754425 TaxID=2570319 RepID=UPI001F44D362|nr:bifunctional metallophosphatase/5'-nucleotidase [Nonomuraea sp. MG754425]MCF6471481.1 bifunctional metallophosphatase/5'-nucleotidase [Nonomuraea sp. MG754425]
MRNLLLALVLGSTSLLPARADTVDIQLLAFNDFHSGFPTSFAATPSGTVPAGGAEYLAAHLDRLQRDNPRGTLRLSAGDNVSSSTMNATALHDEPAIEALNLMRLDASSVGNHEFDEGLAEFRRMENGGCHPIDGCALPNFRGADFPYLGANIIDTTTGKPAMTPYIVKEVKGVKVGIIGVSYKNTLKEAPGPTAPLEGRDEAEAVNTYTAELKAKGVRTIVVLIHQGGGQSGGGLPNRCDNLAGPIKDIVQKFDPEVDAVISGHTHNPYNCVINGIPVTQTSAHTRELTRIALTVDRTTGNPTGSKAENITVTHDIKPDGQIAALRRRTDEQAQKLLDRPVGILGRDLTAQRNAAGESTIGHALADARLFATSAPDTGGAQIGIQPPYGGGIGGDLIVNPTGNEMANLVTHGKALRVQPFSNMLVTMTLTGAQLERLLEQQWCGQSTARVLGVSQGLTYTYDNARPACDKIDPATVKLNGTVVDPSAAYRLTANSFIATGGDGFSVLTEGTDRVEKVRDIDAFETYIRAKSPLQAPDLGRVTRVN